MSFWTAIVVIVAIIAFTEMMKSKHRHRSGIARDHRGREHPAGNDNAEERRELEDLRERIKVLERIATDGNSLDARETKRISAEIEALREKQVDRD